MVLLEHMGSRVRARATVLLNGRTMVKDMFEEKP
jgi:hypothetical protein